MASKSLQEVSEVTEVLLPVVFWDRLHAMACKCCKRSVRCCSLLFSGIFLFWRYTPKRY